MHEPLVPTFFPVLGAQISGAEFQYPDPIWKEMCGQMAHLVADSGNNKGQLGNLVTLHPRQVPLFAHQVPPFAHQVAGFAHKVRKAIRSFYGCVLQSSDSRGVSG
jgi:hypothetical protein